MRKRKYSSLHHSGVRKHLRLSTYQPDPAMPVPQCHNIVSTSQIVSSIRNIDLQRLASLFPFTSYDRKRFAAITIRLANPHCTCLLFGSGKLVITGSTSCHACLVASHAVTDMLRQVNPRDTFEVVSCVVQNIVAHVELPPGQRINLDALYSRFCECSTYQRTVFPGLVLRPPESPIVLLIFNSGKIVCTGGKSYDDIYYGFADMYKVLTAYIIPAEPERPPEQTLPQFFAEQRAVAFLAELHAAAAAPAGTEDAAVLTLRAAWRSGGYPTIAAAVAAVRAAAAESAARTAEAVVAAERAALPGPDVLATVPWPAPAAAV